jgi:ribonuclease HI
MYFDGSFTLNGAREGIVLISPKGDQLLFVIQLHFYMTNSVMEYETLVNGLCIATELGVQWLYIHDDFELIVNQIRGESNYHDSRRAAYRQEARKMEEKFGGFKLHHILWWDNEVAKALAWLGSSHEPPPQGVFLHDLFKPSIWLEEHGSVLMPGIPLGDSSPTPTPTQEPQLG